MRITNNQVRKIQIQTEIKDRNFKYLNDLGQVFDLLDERYQEERNPPNDASLKSADSSEAVCNVPMTEEGGQTTA